jgi:hypothetical protein
MFLEAALLGWSTLALAWWLISWRLVPTEEPAPPADSADDETDNPRNRSLTIFKPLPPLNGGAFDPAGIESFLAQMDSQTELLLGLYEKDLATFERWLARMRELFPEARLRVVWRTAAGDVRNPKVAWLKILAPHATGDLWLWSDADIAVPPGFLQAAREEYAAGGAKMVTWSYIVGEIESAPALLDALYVNVEFFPGVLLLRGRGPVDFGLGAAMLFSRHDFARNVDWKELGAALADDFVLGQKLKPVRIGRDVLTTRADAATWRAALLHYLRWSKTVRWNRPGGTLARIVVLPVLGWIVFVFLRPEWLSSWLGLAGMVLVDSIAATLICRRVGCPLRPGNFALLPLWTVARVLVWAACWLPWPVVWRGEVWHGPFDKA